MSKAPLNNAVGWFEVPVLDMNRAIKFYETVFDIQLKRQEMGPLDMAWFPMQEGPGTMGALVCNEEWYKPPRNPNEGVLLYFTAYSGDLRNELGRVEEAGGSIVIPRKKISEQYGYMAAILDSEGNRIALHSKQ